MSINNIFLKLIKLYLKEINYGNTTINKGRPEKEDIDHYIKVIFYCIKSGIPWNMLKEKLHFSTYHKKFIKWNNLNVFENIHGIIIKLLKYKNLLKDSDLKNLYIDTTMIKNIKGHEFIGPNHYDRNRNGNKISIIVTKSGIPIGMCLAQANTHDINLVNNTIDNIKIKIIGSRIGADKGYTCKKIKEQLKKEKDIDFIACSKSNTIHDINTQKEKDFLKDRYIVEHDNSWIKNYKRIRFRYDINALNYEQSVFFAINNIILNKFKDIQFFNIDYEFKIEFYN